MLSDPLESPSWTPKGHKRMGAGKVCDLEQSVSSPTENMNTRNASYSKQRGLKMHSLETVLNGQADAAIYRG